MDKYQNVWWKWPIQTSIRSNESSIDNLKGYLKKIKTNALKNPNLVNHYTLDTCSCGRNIYYSTLFGIQVPCIHQILNKNIDEKMILECLKFNCNHFSKNSHNFYEEYEIDTNLNFLKKKKNTNDIDENTFKLFNYDEIFEGDALGQIIQRTEFYLASVINEQKINMAVLSVQVYRDMISDDLISSLEKQDYSQFLALYQYLLWIRVMKDDVKI